MVQARDGLGFPLEAVEKLFVVGELVLEHLDRDLALELGVPGVEHGRHVALAELAAQFVFADLIDTAVLRHAAGHQVGHHVGKFRVPFDHPLEMLCVEVKRNRIG